jgi:thiosulfate dehydrogenase (quinone) large subunit
MKPLSFFDPQAAAVALGRWGLGVIFLFYGIGKFPDVAGFANSLVVLFKSTWLPELLVRVFGYALPFLEVAVGALLLLGLARNGVLFATGLLLIGLTFGQVILQQPAVVFYNMLYVFLAAVLLYMDDDDRWTIPSRHSGKMMPPAP